MKAALLVTFGLATILAIVTPGVPAQTPTHKPGGFHSPDLGPGESWNLTLPTEGIYYYHCHPHPFMKGIIEVSASAAGGATIEAKDFKFAPERVKARPGATVTWTNRDTVVHTVDESIPPSGSPTAAEPKEGIPSAAAVTALFAMAAAGLMGPRRQKR